MPSRERWIAGIAAKRGAHAARAHPSARSIARSLRTTRARLTGPPLEAALRVKGARRGKLTPLAVLAGFGLAAGIGLLISGLVFVHGWIAAAGCGLVGLAAATLARDAAGRARTTASAPSFQRDAAALDAYLDDIAGKLPEGALIRLARLKDTLAYLLPALEEQSFSGSIPNEERFFVREAMVRYLPDACRHYLSAVSAGGADVRLEDDRFADESLYSQLDILLARLERTRGAVAAQHARRLAQHEAFIETKRRE